MRLVCPNCGAQYEVDDQVIPEGGRDVQCSNCGHTWFQEPAERTGDKERPAPVPPQDDAADADAEVFPENKPATSEPEADTAAPDVVEAEVIEAEVVKAGPAPGDYEDEGDAAAVFPELPEQSENTDSAAEFVAPEPRTNPRRELDESLREILRAEAAREAEARARARENGVLETQEELGLDEPAPEPESRKTDADHDRKTPDSQERVTRVRGVDTDTGLVTKEPDDTTASGGSESRRDLLPDIDEINSSLESVGPGAIVPDTSPPENEQNGFTRGFVLVLLLAAIAVVLYLYAPVIGDTIPALAPMMDGWVNLVDAARNWADRLVGTALSMVQ